MQKSSHCGRLERMRKLVEGVGSQMEGLGLGGGGGQGCIKRVSPVSWIQDRLTVIRQLASKRTIKQAGPKAQLVLNKTYDIRNKT